VPIDAPALNYPSTYYPGHCRIAVQGSQYQISQSDQKRQKKRLEYLYYS
jgi:hypothetical protein